MAKATKGKLGGARKYMSEINNIRNNKKVRLVVLVVLMAVVAVLYFRNVDTGNMNTVDGIKNELGQNMKPDTLEKKVLIGIMGLLGVGVGMEVSNHDYDLEKLAKTKSFSASKVLRDKSGNVVTPDEVKAGTKVAKATDEYNCVDFKSQPEAQKFYDNAGGVKGDTNGLDGDKNGEACQGLQKK